VVCDRARHALGPKLKSLPPLRPGTTRSVVTSGPYLDLLYEYLSPIILQDGTRVFAAPLRHNAHLPPCDVGYFTRRIFDSPGEFEGLHPEVPSGDASWPRLAQELSPEVRARLLGSGFWINRVSLSVLCCTPQATGLPAVYVVPLDVYLTALESKSGPPPRPRLRAALSS
jgi:hypothetical protein